MRVSGERAFVLHARPWRETSLLVELLTQAHGRVGVVARGVQGTKQQARRAALQPWQSIEFDALPKGELWTLSRWEALDAAPRHVGDAALAGFYVHELLLRLLPRQDAVPEVFARYALLRDELAAVAAPAGAMERVGAPPPSIALPLAWVLRRFERDLLDALGLGLPWGDTADGDALDPAARYRVDPEHGAWRDRSHAPDSLRGSALLALAEDRCPPAEELGELRRGLRAVLAHHLGGKPLKAWGLMAEVARVGRGSGRGPDAQAMTTGAPSPDGSTEGFGQGLVDPAE